MRSDLQSALQYDLRSLVHDPVHDPIQDPICEPFRPSRLVKIQRVEILSDTTHQNTKALYYPTFLHNILSN